MICHTKMSRRFWPLALGAYVTRHPTSFTLVPERNQETKPGEKFSSSSNINGIIIHFLGG